MEKKIIDQHFVLSNGVKIPKIGFGTWRIKPGKKPINLFFWLSIMAIATSTPPPSIEMKKASVKPLRILD